MNAIATDSHFYSQPTTDAPGDRADLLRVEGLVRRFADMAKPAVNGVSFGVGDGELVALLGPSGCGKTTTLRIVGGFETAESGRLFLGGRDITGLPPEQRGIGFVFQDYALFPHLTVLDNVQFGLRALPKAERRRRALEMLEMVGLADLGGRKPHQLSGGQQQRVALARTLAMAPPLVLLDEPFSNLDAAMRVETRQDVRAVLKQSGSAAILVTHDQEEALALADRIVVMEAGRVCQIGTPVEIYRTPRSEFVARFIGRSNILDGMARGMVAETGIGPVPLHQESQGPVRLAVRPEQLVLTPVRDGDSGPARVVRREFRGHDQLYWIEDEGGRSLLAITATAQDIPVGAAVQITTQEPVALVE